MIDADKLAAIVLPWARDTHPEKYEATLKVASKPETLERYLLRLLELRWEQDRENVEWRLDVPLSALEETGITQGLNWHGTPIVVSGRKVEGRTWGFDELAQLVRVENDVSRMALFQTMLAAKPVLVLGPAEIEVVE
jgi:hypothetical protein